MILIKDMTMPFSCERCRFKDADHKECKVVWKRIPMQIGYEARKPDWCPLTDVEPYGIEGLLYKEK